MVYLNKFFFACVRIGVHNSILVKLQVGSSVKDVGNELLGIQNHFTQIREERLFDF